jgi:hypothetical protein
MSATSAPVSVPSIVRTTSVLSKEVQGAGAPCGAAAAACPRPPGSPRGCTVAGRAFQKAKAREEFSQAFVFGKIVGRGERI